MGNKIPGVAVRDTNLGILVENTATMEVSANLFTTYGRNLIKLITGQVTVEGDGGATTLKLRTETGTIDLCAATTVTGDVVGTTYFLTGEVAVIMNGTANAPVVDLATNFTLMPSAPIIFGRFETSDAIEFVQTGDDNALAIKWALFYIPLDDGAYIEAA